MKTAVMICNMGGPNALDEVEPYLLNIFSDPDIIDIPVPGFLRRSLVRWIVKKRVPKSLDIYRKIGGKTPLNDITRQQANALQNALNENIDDSYEVFDAMRYWHPFIEDVWEKILSRNFDKIVILSLYPFYSTTTTGSIIKLVKRLIRDSDVNDKKIEFIDRFGAHPGLVEAIAEQIRCELKTDSGELYRDILFSTHSIPMKRIRNGDPYQTEVEAFMARIKAYLPTELRLHLSYQSKVGPVQWLGPATEDKIEELANNNVKNLLVYPLGFVADNSETIYEIDMLYREFAQAKGIRGYKFIKALNTDQKFIDLLKTLILTRNDQ